MITVFVGDVHQYLADCARLHNSFAQLVTEKNYKNIASGTWYCSLGDFKDPKKFVTVLRQSNEIIYTPPVEWSCTDTQVETEKYLLDLKILEFKIVKNIDHLIWPKLKTFLELADTRKTPGPQLWIAGCSISHGMGVDPDQRYGQLISNQLNLPVSFLTCPGSSVMWAGDQILRSNICSGDTLVWGITSLERFCYYAYDRVSHINISSYTQTPKFNSVVPLNELSSQNQIYQAITKIYQVLNFCNKINVKCVLAGLLTDLEHYNIIDDRYVCLTQEYKSYPMDMKNSDPHPGPDTHRRYADQILKKLNC
jgi:hypothetical protein